MSQILYTEEKGENKQRRYAVMCVCLEEGKDPGEKASDLFFFALFENIRKDLLNLKYYRCKIKREDEEISKRKKR